MSRLLLCLVLWALPCRPARAEQRKSAFPRGFELFRPLLADPRQVEVSARYYRLKGDDMADVALGHSWGLARWRRDGGDAWTFQSDVEGLAFSRFHLSGSVNKFQAVDFHANLPIEARHGRWSGKAMLYHESSHLGDDYIRDTGDKGFRWSLDGLRAILAADVWPVLRVYAGGHYLLHSVPRPQGGGLQGGFELSTPYLSWFKDNPSRLYLAEDLQARGRTAWNLTSRTVLGIAISAREGPRALRVYLAYQDGHSAFGQFFARREHQAELGLAFEL